VIRQPWLTLSACDTATGRADAKGKEVESFGMLAQARGAEAVMATLWPVYDDSTAGAAS
jgi:CHAT domain-containing protein